MSKFVFQNLANVIHADVLRRGHATRIRLSDRNVEPWHFNALTRAKELVDLQGSCLLGRFIVQIYKQETFVLRHSPHIALVCNEKKHVCPACLAKTSPDYFAETRV